MNYCFLISEGNRTCNIKAKQNKLPFKAHTSSGRSSLRWGVAPLSPPQCAISAWSRWLFNNDVLWTIFSCVLVTHLFSLAFGATGVVSRVKIKPTLKILSHLLLKKQNQIVPLLCAISVVGPWNESVPSPCVKQPQQRLSNPGHQERRRHFYFRRRRRACVLSAAAVREAACEGFPHTPLLPPQSFLSPVLLLCLRTRWKRSPEWVVGWSECTVHC